MQRSGTEAITKSSPQNHNGKKQKLQIVKIQREHIWLIEGPAISQKMVTQQPKPNKKI